MAERYPAFRAGQKVTGELLTSMQSMTVRKVSDTARTSVTPTNDPELQIALEANGVYEMNGTLWISASNDTTDFAMIWAVPAGTDGTYWRDAQTTAATAVDGGTARWGGLAITASTNVGATSAGVLSVGLQAMVIVGGTAGTMALSWNANAASGTVTLLSDSYLTFRRIA
jgi:hypothetical protein